MALRAVAGSSGGSGTIGGSIAATQIAFGSGTNTITGSANLTYTGDLTQPILQVGSGTTASAGIQMGYSGTSGFGWVGQTSVTPTTANAALLVGNVPTILGSGSNSGSLSFRPNGSGNSSFQWQMTTTGNLIGSDGTNFLGSSSARVATAFLGSSTAITASAPAIDVAQTWNNGAVVFTAAKINVTNTASAAGSLLQDWQVNSASVANIDKGGTVTASTFQNLIGTTGFNSSGFSVGTSTQFLFSSTAAYGSAPDVALKRNAAGVVEVNNGTAGTFADLKLKNLISTNMVELANFTVAGLPAGVVGAMAFVTDATLTAITGLGLAPIGGGANKVPVYYDGAWKIL